MGAAKGNQNAKGNPGGGRNSAYEESMMADLLKDAFFGGVDTDALAKEMKGKKLKLFQLTLARAIKNDRILLELFKKLYPDKIEHSGGMENAFDVTLTTVDAKNKLGKNKETD